MNDKKTAPEEATATQPAPASPASEAPGGKITKIEAVRQAMKALGRKASPSAVQSYLKDHMGIEISKDHASNAKGVVRRQDKKRRSAKKLAKAAEEKKAAPKAKAKPASAPVAPKAGKGKGSIKIDDLQAVKALVKRVGSGRLRSLIDLLGQ